MGLIIAMTSVVLLLGFLFINRKPSLKGNEEKDVPDNLVNQVKKAEDRIPENLFILMKEEGINLVPGLIDIWPELTSEKKDQLWQFWNAEGYIAVFMKRLGDKKEEKLMEATQVLAVLSHQETLIPLLDALTLPDQYIPARVAEVLLSFGSEAVELMTARLSTLPEEAKCLVISILEEFEDPKAVPFLLKELIHPSSQVRRKAVEALGQMGDEEIVDPIIGMMEDDDWGVRSRAAKALGKINSIKAIPVLEKALQDQEWWVRTNAEESLKRINLNKKGDHR